MDYTIAVFTNDITCGDALHKDNQMNIRYYEVKGVAQNVIFSK